MSLVRSKRSSEARLRSKKGRGTQSPGGYRGMGLLWLLEIKTRYNGGGSIEIM
jgi:hypothetical protein